jgi:hypothetical protein
MKYSNGDMLVLQAFNEFLIKKYNPESHAGQYANFLELVLAMVGDSIAEFEKLYVMGIEEETAESFNAERKED